MKPGYYSIEWIIENKIIEPWRSTCINILLDNKDLFLKTPGSSHNHQAWPGGYLDHVQEVMNAGLVIWEAFNEVRPWLFSLSDALVVLFFHDIEKPWKYEFGKDDKLYTKPSLVSKKAQHEFKMEKMEEYGFVLHSSWSTFEIENAIKYTEGELDDYTPKRRSMSPMAAFCHMCDIYSARIGFDHPLAKDDPWLDAKRNRLEF